MSRRTEKNVGVIGLGIIGSRVAETVRRRGFSVFVWNRTPRPFPNFVGSPEEIAELCDFVQIFVSDDEALLEMVQQMRPALKAHHVVMAHSTVAPHTIREAAEVVHRRGAQLLDAPFTGSKEAAGKGELIYYVGGDDAAFRRARPVLQASSKEIVEIGEIGQATTIKVATNMITAATVQAAAEALALVHHCGIPLDKFAAAMRNNGSNSGTLTMKLPKMLEGDFETHFSVKHMLKDVQIASRIARSYGLSLAATSAARDALVEEARRGRGDDDYSGVVRVLFPDGPPEKTEAEMIEEQTTLSGLEHREGPAAPVSETLEPALEAEDVPPITSETEPIADEKKSSDETIAPPSAINGHASTDEGATEADTERESVEVEARTEPPVEAQTPVAEVEAEPATRGGFLSRLFGKGIDY